MIVDGKKKKKKTVDETRSHRYIYQFMGDAFGSVQLIFFISEF